MKKFHDYIDGDDDGNKSDDTFEDDNLYEDYEKYVDSTKKTQHGYVLNKIFFTTNTMFNNMLIFCSICF